jgi:hypothetical protein
LVANYRKSTGRPTGQLLSFLIFIRFAATERRHDVNSRNNAVCRAADVIDKFAVIVDDDDDDDVVNHCVNSGVSVIVIDVTVSSSRLHAAHAVIGESATFNVATLSAVSVVLID